MASQYETKQEVQECSIVYESPSSYVSGTRTHGSSHFTRRSTPFTARVSSGTDLPNFRDIISAKGDATNRYSASFKKYGSVTLPKLTCTEKANGYKGQSYSFYEKVGFNSFESVSFNHASEDPNLSSKNDQILAVKLNSKIKAMTADPQTIPFLVEAKNLARDCDSAAQAFLRFLLAVFKLYRGDFSSRNRKRLLGAMSEMWLAFSFTINPTISDTRNLAGALAESISAAERTVAFSVNNSFDLKSNAPNGFVENTGFGYYYATSKTHTKVSTNIFGGCKVKDSMSVTFEGITKNFNLTEFVPSTWELIPFSWCIDYFVNVGTFLSSRIYRDQDFQYIGKTVKRSSTITKDYEHKTFANMVTMYDIKTGQKGRIEGEYITFDRYPLDASALPTISLAFKDLSGVSDHATNKLLNLFSILFSHK